MKLASLISPGLWDLLERLRGHIDVVVDLVDVAGTPLLAGSDEPTARLVRHLVGVTGPHGLRDRCTLAVNTGQHQVFDTRALHVTILPLRHDRRVAGLLVLAQALVQDGAPEPVRQRLERLAWSLRATLEADIETQLRLGREEGRARWLATVPRFLEHLHRCDTEEALFDALVQGAAIWGDVDARIYRRSFRGHYELVAALPSILAEAPAHHFPTSLLALRTGPVRVTSIAEIEQFGWPTSCGELLILPIGTPDPDVVLTLAGPVDSRIEETFTAATLVAAACLRGFDSVRATRLEAGVRERLSEATAGFPGPLTGALSEIAAHAGATHVRLLLQESGAPGGVRTLAAVGGSSVSKLPRELPRNGGAARSPERIVVPLLAGAGAAWLDLGCGGSRRFSAGDAELAERAAGLLGTWLGGAMQALAQSGVVPAALVPAGLEPRIQEEVDRARRFNLELGLLLVESPEEGRDRHALTLVPVLEAIRSQLRGSDLVGRLADGSVAALVVHTDERGLSAVASRIERRLARLSEDGPSARLGRAAYPADGDTPGQLAASARADLARRAAPGVRPLIVAAPAETDEPGQAFRAS